MATKTTDPTDMPVHPRQVAEVTPEKPAIIMAESAESISYAQLVRRSDKAAHLFASLGATAGDTIAIFLENDIRYAELCWAAKNSGLFYVCISTHLNAADTGYIIENCGACLLVTTQQLARTVDGTAAGKRIKKLLIDDCRAGDPSYESLLNAFPASHVAGRNAGASMLYSSGTTGRPKAVRPALPPQPAAQPPVRFFVLQHNFGFATDMTFINAGPLYHAAPLRMAMSVHRVGGTVIVHRKFDEAGFLESIERFGVTHGFVVPTMLIRLLNYRDSAASLPSIDTLQYMIHGGAPCPPSVKEAILDWWGPVLYEVYGGTEGNGHTTISPAEWLAHRGSVGRPATGCRIKIVGDAGQSLGPNERGLIYMSNGREFSYLGDEDKTTAVHDQDGYATLGDIGYLDDEGYLYLTDRQSHMIISGGVNIYPQEAENILISHPLIADVAVIGVPNEEFGEEVKALVQLVPESIGSDAIAADIIDYCRCRLSRIKCPRSVDFVTRLPRSETGKLLKREIRRPYWSGHGATMS